MNTTDGNPPSHIPERYTKELHLQHVQAFWDGELEWLNPFSDEWTTSSNPPHHNENPSRFRIKAPQKIRPWNTTEIPLGAWLKEKGSQDTSIIVAVLDGRAVRVEWNDHCAITPEYLLNYFEHSTDQGKTWLPCGVLE